MTPEIAAGLVLLLVLAAGAAAVGLGFGRVLAPRIGQLADRIQPDESDEGAGDRPA